MNFRLYIFGESSGYKQYPDDSINFKSYYENQQSTSLLHIKRKADLAYYIYTQRIDKSKKSFLGFCLVFNGVYIKDIKSAITLFEKAYSDCVLSGKLFKINQTGQIGFAVEDFGSQKDEIDRITGMFNSELERNSRTLFAPLSKTYKVGQGTKSFTIDDSPETIGNAISFYDLISIPNNSHNEDLDYVGQMIKKLYAENKELKSEYVALNKQKKQYRWVALLSLAVIASLVGLYFLNDNLSGVISDQGDTINRMINSIYDRDTHIALLQDTLTEERNTIESQKKEIRVLNSNIFSYQDSLKVSRIHNEELQSSLSSCQSELSSSRRELSSCQASLRKVENNFSSLKKKFPIDITDIEIANTYKGGDPETDYGYTIYSRNTMYLRPRIKYTGINSGRTITLKVKWYTPDGRLSTGNSSSNGFSQSESLYVYSGSNTTTLNGWGNDTKGNWGKGTYRIEIWYEDVCLRAENFTIY